MSDADCGAGYVYNSANAASSCAGAACDVAGVSSDKAKCCLTHPQGVYTVGTTQLKNSCPVTSSDVSEDECNTYAVLNGIVWGGTQDRSDHFTKCHVQPARPADPVTRVYYNFKANPSSGYQYNQYKICWSPAGTCGDKVYYSVAP